MDIEIGFSGEDHTSNGGHEKEDEGEEKFLNKKNFVLAYETLGVVFGGLATSPLYVYNALSFNNTPTEEDYMGIFSLMFWTLTMIGFVKYVCIALNADDNGEGGTFALYSLLCKHTSIGILSSQSTDSKSNSNNIMGIETKSKLQRYIEQSIIARRILLFIAILGMCMLIGDGVLTPAISVLSAIDGLREPVPSFGKFPVEVVSAVLLIALFLLQRYGTSRVSFLFSPIMTAWTISTPLIGIYSFCKYYPAVWKALSPHYIILFFLRNGKQGWHLLGGVVLVITGAEAMFADLGHFKKKAIQIAFLFGVYPSLVLTYAGQTAYLIRNLNDYPDGFYKFIPHSVYWPMFIVATLTAIVASQALISATFSVMKQSVALDYFPRVKIVHSSKHSEGMVYSPDANYILMILCVIVIFGFGDARGIGNAFGLVVIFVMFITTILLSLVMIVIWRTPLIFAMLYFVTFFIIEGVYISAVLTKFLDGGWFPFAISIVLATIMFAWYYGRQRKQDYEKNNKLTLEQLSELLSRSEMIQRVRGLCFFYSKTQDGLPLLLGHYINNVRSLHRVTVIVTFKSILAPNVSPNERVSIKKCGVPGVYGCLIKHGFADSFTSNEDDNIVTLVTKSLKAYVVKNEAQLPSPFIEEEIEQIEEAKSVGVVHVRGKTRFPTSKRSGWFDGMMLGLYEFLHKNCRSAMPSLGMPSQQKMEIGMLYES